VQGGSVSGRQALGAFVAKKLRGYAEGRNEPNAPARTAASGLSPYLHYGHISIQEVAEAVLGADWTPQQINSKTRNKDDFFCRDANVNSFLDEAITWRDLGYHWHFSREAPESPSTVSWTSPELNTVPRFNFQTMDFSPGGESTLDLVLPEWARATLRKHQDDPRQFLYSLEEFEAGATHDPLWNAAQLELKGTGRIHNYLRMLWAKKVLEWSISPADAYGILEHLNNKYALDGRDPNSYTGILWCFGLFDRPWPPERSVFGNVRYMSSENTARKFDLSGYFAYVRALPAPSR
jgi:deoxyribodipyrimidine photo-lyase